MSTKIMGHSFFAVGLVLFTILSTSSGENTIGRDNLALRTTPVIKTNQNILPASFIPNAGQADPSVLFQVPERDATLSFKSDGAWLNLYLRSTPFNAKQASLSQPKYQLFSQSETPSITIHKAFLESNPNPPIEGVSPLPGNANSFIGNDPTKWRTNVPTYGGILYHNLYSGIDLSYTGGVGLLKGTFLLSPGADPNIIRWRYGGATQEASDPATGNLTIYTDAGTTLTETTPIAWQIKDSKWLAVIVRYQLNSDGSVAFVVGDYDRTLPLTIDPGLDYSIYLSGSFTQNSFGIAVDDNGNAYVTGFVRDNFPTTGGAYQTKIGGSDDAFVSKLNTTGDALVYSTYLGGSGIDTAYSIAVDKSGNA